MEYVIRKNINFIKYIARLALAQPILSIATVAMLITCIFVPIDKEYLDYFDFKTISCLFCTLAVVGAFKHIYLFEIVARKIVQKLHNLRNAILGLVFITFFGSMLLANDMALLTFLPLGFFVLSSTGKLNYMAFTFIMQNIAANLGGMITPFGNPQNLYIYSYFNISTTEFFSIMLKPFLVATLLILICCLCIKKEPLELIDNTKYTLNIKSTLIYSVLFLCSILIVFRIIPFIIGTILITAALCFLDSKAIKEVNYPLLLTFCVFFVFSGNVSRIGAISSLFENLLPQNPMFVSLLSCQLISNVPSAILLSHFTTDYSNLLVAVNIGGLGTLIASLASLITFSEYRKNNPTKTKSYILKFTLFNLGFILVLLFFQML